MAAGCCSCHSCCCSCCWAINQRAKVKHWLTIQSTDLNWRIYLPNERRRRWQWTLPACLVTCIPHTCPGIKLGDSPNCWVVAVAVAVACSRPNTQWPAAATEAAAPAVENRPRVLSGGVGETVGLRREWNGVAMGQRCGIWVRERACCLAIKASYLSFE